MRRKSSSCCSSSSSKSENGEEPRLSGAYIRSLVKELTSSRTKDPDRDDSNIDNINNNITSSDDKQEKLPRQRKQGRRRVHKNRPYKEKLLNMAEARREIVTALKLHRAAMKAKEQQKSGPQNQPFQPESEESRRNPRFYASNSSISENFPVNYADSSVCPRHMEAKSGPGNQSFRPESGKFSLEEKSRGNSRFYASNFLIADNFPVNYTESYIYPPGCIMARSGAENQAFKPEPENSRINPRNNASKFLNSDNFPVNHVENYVYLPGFYSPYSWPVFSAAPSQLVQENLDFVLPRRTLGLNLNLQEFNNLERNSVYSNTNPSSIYSSSSASITSSSPGFSISKEEINPGARLGPDSGLSPGIDDFKETADIRAIEDHNQKIELNDCLNSLNIQKDEDFVSSPFDEIMEFPEWMNANDGSLLQDVNGFCSNESFQDPALPCMEIEEIEEIDGQWLA